MGVTAAAFETQGVVVAESHRMHYLTAKPQMSDLDLHLDDATMSQMSALMSIPRLLLPAGCLDTARHRGVLCHVPSPAGGPGQAVPQGTGQRGGPEGAAAGFWCSQCVAQQTCGVQELRAGLVSTGENVSTWRLNS